MNLLQVQGIKKYFLLRRTGFFERACTVKAVDDVDMTINEGETVGLVGESGCGKTTLGRIILRLIDPTEGRILFEGRDLLTCSKNELRSLRRFIQVIFQDPFSSLNPRMTVGRIIERNLIAQGVRGSKECTAYVNTLMELVGLRPEFVERYPHEMSGGQRQRIAIARAIATQPKLIVADEPTSALDVSVQAQILNLLADIQKKQNIAFLLISHNIHVVKHLSKRVGVMYLGKIVELAEKESLFGQPLHPYTQVLLLSVLEPDPQIKLSDSPLLGEVPSAMNPPSGCHFHPRCTSSRKECSEEVPILREVVKGHYVACHLYGS